MIVECEACQAKFKLDDSKVPEKGIKVRCSKCKHIFMVHRAPPPAEEPASQAQQIEEPLGVSEGPAPPAEGPAADEGLEEEEAFQIDEGEAERLAADMGITGAGESVGEAEASFEPTIKIDLSDQQEMPFEEEEAFPEEEAAEVAPKKKVIGTPFLIAIIALVVIVGLAAAYFYVLPNFMGPAETPTSNLMTTNIDGNFEQNVQIPKIFVIKGTVINKSKKARRFIQVKGILYNQKGKPVKSQLAYCGNLISKKDLKTKSPKFIEKAMNNMSGSRGVNNRVNPGAFIPFMVVFFYLPDDMAEYSVEVVNSQILE